VGYFTRRGVVHQQGREIFIFLNPIIVLFADSIANVDSIFSMEVKPKVAVKIGVWVFVSIVNIRPVMAF
jgi:hypothetical protein